MRSYDAAEICELVGLYLLNQLSTVIDKSSVGLYRDDGLAAINNANGPKLDRIRKDIIALFKEEGLSITIETNLIKTDFLDVTFNPATKKYFPFRKAYDTPLYINAFSKHPSTIIKLNRFPSVATEINFYWPKLRSNRHGVVFNCLLQFQLLLLITLFISSLLLLLLLLLIILFLSQFTLSSLPFLYSYYYFCYYYHLGYCFCYHCYGYYYYCHY